MKLDYNFISELDPNVLDIFHNLLLLDKSLSGSSRRPPKSIFPMHIGFHVIANTPYIGLWRRRFYHKWNGIWCTETVELDQS